MASRRRGESLGQVLEAPWASATFKKLNLVKSYPPPNEAVVQARSKFYTFHKNFQKYRKKV